MNRALENLDRYTLVVGRSLLGLYFILPGIMKVTAYANTLALMQTKGVPLAWMLLPLIIFIQIGFGLMLVLGKQLRLSALMLFSLTILINVYIHNFWALQGDPNYAHELQNFVKNLGIAAGLLVLSTKESARTN